VGKRNTNECSIQDTKDTMQAQQGIFFGGASSLTLVKSSLLLQKKHPSYMTKSVREDQEYSDDEIEHSEFEDCYLNGDLNPFWKKIFLELSKGSTPKGTKLTNKGYFICNIPKKEFNLNFKNYFETHHRAKFINKIINLFNANLGIYDTTFVSSARASSEDVSKGISKMQTWSELKTKNNKDEGILNFIIQMKKTYDLSEEIAKRLFSDITMLDILKIVNADNVQYANGKIEKIDCVSFTKGDYEIKYPTKTLGLKYSSVIEETIQIHFGLMWDESKFVV
jgi:hypothetical protein